MGAQTVLLGVIPTPAVAYLTRKYEADAGVVISASHNSAEYNGIKIFNGNGYKLSDAVEEKIEELVLDRADKLVYPTGDDVGTATRCETAVRDYVDFAKHTIDCDLSGIRIAIDCANGASYKTAVQTIVELGAEVFVVSNHPNGTNINLNCGSTHMDRFCEYVKNINVDIGLSFDGDADRLLVADEMGNVVDGDKSFAIKANYYKSAFANFVNGGGHYPQSGVAEPVRVGTWPNKAKNQAHDSQQYRIYSVAAKRDTLCGNGGGMGAKTGLYAVPVEFTDGVPADSVCDTDGKAYSVYKVKDGEITINNKQYPIKLEDGHYIIRKLTVSECMRLQTVPEWYEFPVSDTQAYKMLGNGWTVSVISHLLNSIKATQQSEI